jgi:hypothetical protein
MLQQIYFLPRQSKGSSFDLRGYMTPYAAQINDLLFALAALLYSFDVICLANEYNTFYTKFTSTRSS